jgi:hypothetical protein
MNVRQYPSAAPPFSAGWCSGHAPAAQPRPSSTTITTVQVDIHIEALGDVAVTRLVNLSKGSGQKPR